MLSAGTQLGPYEVLGLLATGGMGEVYRARDPRLGREVAVKVLPEGVSDNTDRLRRFEQEARAAGALNHPNILAIHDVGVRDGAPYVVSELLVGETLRARLRAGALPLRDAIGFATQIARGLAAAHEKGIVHRDLKPENLLVTKDGRVKILDFGLAKLLQSGPLVRGPDDSVATDTPTESGVAVGTAGYMSPEQVRGETVDHHSDIFALGAVLYEMLSGRRAFHAATPAETLTAILREEPPDLLGVGRMVPAALGRIAHRCLDKRPERRFHSAEDVAFALEAVSDVPTAAAPLAERGGRRRPFLASLAVLVALAVGGVIVLSLGRWAPSKAVPPPNLVPLTNLPGSEMLPAVSRDGSRVAFAWNGDSGDNWDIYVKQIGTEARLRLTSDPGFDGPSAWSPDGQHLAFCRVTGEALSYFIVPALGGPERRVHSTNRPGCRPCSISWSPDGASLAVSDRSSGGSTSIALLSIDTLERTPLTSPPADLRGGCGGDDLARFSPDGRLVAFVRRAVATPGLSDIYVVSVDGEGEPRRLTLDRSRIYGMDWAPDGRTIIFSSERAGSTALWRLAVAGGDPERVTPAGEVPRFVSISRVGNRLVYDRDRSSLSIWKAETQRSKGDGRPPTEVAASTAPQYSPAFSSDGSRIAFVSRRSGSDEIWACRADGSSCVRLTSFGGGSESGSPHWSPDGREVAFDHGPDGNQDVFAVDVETHVVRRLTRDPSEDVVPRWSRDGRWVYFGSNRSGSWQVWKTPSGGGPAIQVTTAGGFMAVESPRGDALFFIRTEWGTDIWKRSLASGEEGPVLAYPVKCWGLWDVGDAGLYYVNRETKPRPAIELFDPVTRQVRRIVELDRDPSCCCPNLALSPDGRWILYGLVDRDQSDLTLIEGFR